MSANLCRVKRSFKPYQNEHNEFSANHFPENRLVAKQTILSYFGAAYDPLEIISSTMAKGKHVY